MDKYDEQTIKEITTQFPRDKTIQFLVKIIKEQRIERGKIESDLAEARDIIKKQDDRRDKNLESNAVTIKEINSIAKVQVRKEEIVIHMRKNLKKVEERLNRVKKDRDLMICRNIQLQNQLDALKTPTA